MTKLTLIEWAAAYAKYKDSVSGKIKEIAPDPVHKKIEIVNRNGSKETYLCSENLKDLAVTSLKDEKVACLNRKDNLNWLLSNWETIKDKKCIFIFVNLEKSEKWAINPFMHHSITDKSALKSGLKSLFDSVPEEA